MEILLKDLSPGQIYDIQLRAKNASGSSAWSRRYDIQATGDVAGPAPVKNLTLEPSGTSFVSTWDKPILDSNGNTLKDFKDYRITIEAESQSVIYYAAQERFDFPFELNVSAFGSPKAEIKIIVQARDQVGNLSTPVEKIATNSVPSNMTNLQATSAFNAIALSWDISQDQDFKSYEIFSSENPSFTPSVSNRIYTGSATSFIFPAYDPDTYYFKGRIIDVFDQGSSSFATANAVPDSPTGFDTSPPDDPTGVTVISAPGENGTASMTVSWSPVLSSNLRYYVVRWGTDEVEWHYATVPADQTSTIVSGLDAGSGYYVAVASVSNINTYSDFVNAHTFPIVMAEDTTAPSKPSAPSVSTSTLSALVSHSMTKDAGGQLETDIAYLEVHASLNSVFTPSASTLRGTIDYAGQGVPVSGVFFYPVNNTTTNLYWKVIAVDTSNNKSEPSISVSATPGLIDGINISNASIGNAQIGGLDASKLNAGSAIINDLFVRSEITLDSSSSGIKSNNYSVPTQSGWKLNQEGLTIYDGSISAKSLQLQDSDNIAPPMFADFEFSEDYYHSNNIPNEESIFASSGMLLDIDVTEKRYGTQSLRIFNSSITNPTLHIILFSNEGFTGSGLNINIDPGEYIYSFWAKKNGSIDQEVTPILYTETGVTITGSPITIGSLSFGRYSSVLTIPSGVSRVKMGLQINPISGNTGYDILLDGIQLERKIGGSVVPSAWTAPSRTTIDGGSIVTGSIRSSAPSATMSNQPAWSLNTEGGMQVGDARVRGSLIVGTGDADDYVNIVPSLYASFEENVDYFDGSGSANPSYFDQVGLDQLSLSFITPSIGDSAGLGSITGEKSLRLSNSLVEFANYVYFYLCPSEIVGNISVIPNKEYILSIYIRRINSSLNQSMAFGVMDNNGVITSSTTADLTNGNLVRRSMVFAASPTASLVKIFVKVGPSSGFTGVDLGIDSIQLEEKPLGTTSPSVFKLPADNTSYVRSSSYNPGVSGWSINSDGSVEFNNGLFRGAVAISQYVNGYQYALNFQNRGSVFKYRNASGPGNSDYSLSGASPTMHYTGYAQQYVKGWDGNLVLDPNSPIQAVSRLTPAGSYQILYDPTNSNEIFRSDGNFIYDAFNSKRNESYAFSTSEWGTRRSNNVSETRRAFVEHKSKSFMRDNFASVPKLSTEAIVAAEASAETGLWYDLSNTVKTVASGSNNFKSGNMIKDYWDIFDHPSGVSYYQSNSIVNRLTWNSIQTGAQASGRTLNAVRVVVAAGGGNPIFYTSPSGVYDNIVQPNQYHIISGWFSTNQADLQVRSVLKLSNGMVYNGDWSYINKQFPLISGQLVNHPYYYGYNSSVNVPLGSPSTAQIGFEFKTATTGSQINITALTFSNGLDDNDRVRFSARDENQYTEGSAGVYVKYEPYPDIYEYVSAANNPERSQVGWNKIFKKNRSEVKLQSVWTENSVTTTRSLTVNRNGIQRGSETDSGMPHGLVMYDDNTRTINANSTLYLPGYQQVLIPSLNSFDGIVRGASWTESGEALYNNAGISSGFTARRSGLHAITATVRFVNGSHPDSGELMLRAWNATINQEIGSTGPSTPADPNDGTTTVTLTALFHASAGDNIVFFIQNVSGFNYTINYGRFSFAQLI